MDGKGDAKTFVTALREVRELRRRCSRLTHHILESGLQLPPEDSSDPMQEVVDALRADNARLENLVQYWRGKCQA